MTMNADDLGNRIWELRTALLRLACAVLRNPQDAEDAVSQAVVRAFERLDTLRDDAAVRPWLMKITIRCCYERARRARREMPYQNLETLCPPVWSQEGGALVELIAHLPPGQREALVLYYYEGFSVEDIAYTLGVPRPTISMRLLRGRNRLRELIEQERSASL